MRPLTPDERAAILAEHPGTSEADLDELEALIAQRQNPPAPPEDLPAHQQQRLAAAEIRIAHVRELDARIVQLQDQRFPRLNAALARAQQQEGRANG